MFDGSLDSLRVKIFADGADLEGMVEMARQPWVAGLTTNPTLMRKAGVTNYERFAREVLERIPHLPVSFEVFSDEFGQMRRQAEMIASWGSNVYVKVPVTNTKGDSSSLLIRSLSNDGVKLNVTALTQAHQVKAVAECLVPGVPAIISVFAGRVADTGRDPVPVLRECLGAISDNTSAELLWASPRELLNLIQADDIGCHIITMTNDLLSKVGIIGRDLDAYSLDTVKMFHQDAMAAAFEL